MHEYEPYLVSKKREEADPAKPELVKVAAPAVKADDSALPFSKEALDAQHRKASVPTTETRAAPPPQGDEHAPAPDGGVNDSDKPWWQRHDADKRLNEVKLDELEADADAILAKRMVKGFYVAVDREFNWNGRPWYKTTKGLVAPADRLWVTTASEFHGVELSGEPLALPMGFTYGWQKGRPKYELDASGKLKPAGTLENHAPVALTGQEKEFSGKKYLEAKAGFWVQASQLRLTTPGPPPADLAPNERWVDVNLTTQTLVAFEGTRAVYATLISSGKENKDKDKDHRTPTGEYRIREKHVTTTMDGDGSAAGDLPYSIEDVPYVMYFHKAYALHGAFWHGNYGTQMSHGCVNLSPLDAKWVFLFTEPHLPEGWHGVWATTAHPGSRVVVHE
jgi:lipoprotein-anchoring transpeptidase ErfK/SrfK